MKNFQADYGDLQHWLDVATGELGAMGLDLEMNGDLRD